MPLSKYLEVIVKWRKFIIRNVLIVSIVAAIISLLITNTFTATATVLPPNPSQEAMFGFMSTLMPGTVTSGFSSLLSGMGAGITTPSDLYATIMQSSRIKREIIEKYGLKKEFKAKTMHDAFEALDDITKVEITPEGIISVSVTYKNRNLATDIANSYVEELDRFNTYTTMTVGKRFRLFIEQRLKDNIDTLAKAEENLRKFQEKHRTVALEVEMENAIKAIAQLKSQIVLLEVQKGAMSSASQNENPYLSEINNQLRELKQQLSKIEFGDKTSNAKEFGAGFGIPFSQLPEVALEYARLFRDVTVQSTIYELLTQQYEQAKIMELKDTPTVQILDKAHVPEKKSFPRRTLIVALTFLISLFVHIPLVFFLEYVHEIKSDPEKHTFATRLISELTSDYKEFSSFVKKLFRRSKN